MRSLHVVSLAGFAFAVVLAACSGGHGSNLVPAAGGNAPPGGGNSNTAKTTQATMVLRIPPPSAQTTRKRPFYISSATQSFAVYVAPVGQNHTPSPAGAQIFPVATPSPCAAASGGGDVCTLVVTAPYGEDVFYLTAYATASPGALATPLSEYVSGAVDISSSPSASASPLDFTMNAVVAKVAISVASPDPHNTPNTQVFTIGAPASAPLAVAAYDAAGSQILDDPTTPFASAVTIAVSPAPNDGMTLKTTAAAQCGSSAASNGSTATIACAADLDDFTLAYDGSAHPDSSDHPIDAFSVSASGNPSPAPSPANVVLAGNVLDYPIPLTGYYMASGSLVPLSSGELLYVLTDGDGDNFAGTFTPSTGAVSPPAAFGEIIDPSEVAVSPGGQIWMLDGDTNELYCWNSVTTLMSGSGNPTTPNVNPVHGTDPVTVYSIAVDPANNGWFVGVDFEAEMGYFGEFAQPGSTCPTLTAADYSYVSLETDAQSSTAFAAYASHDGAILNGIDGGFFTATTANITGGTNAGNIPVNGWNSTSFGLAVDPANETYAAFQVSGDLFQIESLTYGAASANTVGYLTPYDAAVNGVAANPQDLSVFSPSGGAADRAIYADADFLVLGVVSNVGVAGETASNELAALNQAQSVFATAYGPHGEQYVLYNGGPLDGPQPYIARVIDTNTWAVPVTSVYDLCGVGNILSVNERGDSGPFTLSTTAAFNPLPAPTGNPHDFAFSIGTAPVTITDKNGRSATVTIDDENACD